MDDPQQLFHPEGYAEGPPVPIDLPHDAEFLIDGNEMQGNHRGYHMAPAEVTNLVCGDYSVRVGGVSLETVVCVERKSLPNILHDVAAGRKRMESALRRMEQVRRPYMVLETTWSRLTRGSFERTKVSAESVCGTLVAWSLRYGVHIVLAGGRDEGQRMTQWILTRAAKDFAARKKAENGS